MNESTYKMTGICMMIVSVFFLAGGLYLTDGAVSAWLHTLLLIIGLALLVCGIVCYKVIRKEDDHET